MNGCHGYIVTALNTFGANGLVSRWTLGTGSRFYLFDPLGNVAQRLDASGQVVSSDLYDAYGLRLDPPDVDDADPYGWGGQWGYYRDQSLGLVLMTHRYYDPQTGRFLTRDPIGYVGGLNLYGYVEANPVNWVDRLGLSRKPGKTPPKKWPPLPDNLAGKKPKWNPDGYWEGKNGDYVWDPTGHGGGQRGQGGHWDKDGGGGRWDQNGNPLPGTACKAPGWWDRTKDFARQTGQWVSDNKGPIIVGGIIVVGVLVAPEITLPALGSGALAAAH